MAKLRISLFGRFEMMEEGVPLHGELSSKACELCSYLVLYRNRPHAREKLATVLWPERYPASDTKAYLRKTIWQLQQGLRSENGNLMNSVLRITPEWIQFDGDGEVQADVAEFEKVYMLISRRNGEPLNSQFVRQLEQAVSLYRGALLENWYYEWCDFERDRLQDMYLIMLDKLLEHCIDTGNVEAGREYGNRILRIDRARERTYRQLMELHYQAGDRTKGLRLYDQCAGALQEELGIEPGPAIQELHRRLRLGQMMVRPIQSVSVPSSGDNLTVRERLEQIKLLQELHASIQMQIQQNIHAVERALNLADDSS